MPDKLPKAIEVLKGLVEENGNNLQLILSYAEALMRGGRYAEAERQVQHILAERPNHLEPCLFWRKCNGAAPA